VSSETGEERRKRERQRVLFDEIAELYESTRRGYPSEIIDTVISTAGLGPGVYSTGIVGSQSCQHILGCIRQDRANMIL
jgi:hypothetical protein